MKKKIKSDMPAGKLTKVADFLPPPQELAIPEDTVKVTIALNRSSIEFFKKAAKANHTKYQKMIREVIDYYASHYQNNP